MAGSASWETEINCSTRHQNSNQNKHMTGLLIGEG